MNDLNTISFVLDGRIVSIDFRRESRYTPTTTVLEYLRTLPEHQGVKEGCAEGDCGACTVVAGELRPDGRVSYRAVNSCLMFLPMLHRRHLITIENVAPQQGELHPIQRAMVDWHASQCGFCTPGMVMSLYALWLSGGTPSHEELTDALTGNLCRCTGYRPILSAAESALSARRDGDRGKSIDTVAQMLGEIDAGPRSLSSEDCMYEQPVTIPAAIKVLERHPDTVIVHGGTDIGLRVTKSHSKIHRILDLSRIPALREFSVSGEEARLGSGLTLTDVRNACGGEFPALAKVCGTFGSRQVRNLATLGGNLGTASPVGDSIPVLMAYDARVHLQGPGGARALPISKFITSYRTTARLATEIITGVTLPRPPEHAMVDFCKVSRRPDVDIATVSAAFRIEKGTGGSVSRAIVAFGGMDALPRRATKAEEALAGRIWSRETVERAAATLEQEFHPISDVRGSAEFRMAAAKNLMLRFWLERRNGGSGA